jgi:glycosyltransferase involved in cell wall biosynthesis
MSSTVLHIIGGLGLGGAEMAMFRLISSSTGGQYIHAVVSLTPGGSLAGRFIAAGVEVTEFDIKARPFREFIRLVGFIRKRRPDVVQTWMYHADLLGGIAARAAGLVNIVWGIRTTDVAAGGGKLNICLRAVCARLSTLIPKVIVCAAEAARGLHVNVGYDGERMAVVPNGLDLSHFCARDSERKSLRHQCGFTDADIVIGMLGRFNPAKDPENFIIAASLVAKSRPNTRFLLVGRNMMSVNTELAEWIEKSGCPGKFVLLGERSDAAACLAAMDIFCLSSRTEGFPNVLAEAMAMQLPCVTTDVGDAALLLGNPESVVPKENPRALAIAIEALVSLSEDQRRRLGAQAALRISSEFSIERMRERFEVIYNKLINK